MRTGRLFALWLTLLLLASTAAAEAYWGISGRPLTCREDRPGCSVLQTVMTGCFAAFDPANNLDARVFSAALAQLKAVPEEDFPHFCEEFGMEAERLKTCYYIAMGNCLWADIIATPARDEAAYNTRTVLYLFLCPEGHENADEQIETIRGMLTDDVITQMAESAELPEAFVRYLLTSEDWADPAAETE